MKIIDRVKYDGNSNGSKWLIYKYPSEQLVLGTQLIVSHGQEALFIKGGIAVDLFGPGTFTLSTENLPLLNKIVNLPFDGKSPFTAEVYFINKTDSLDMKWGTSTPIPIEDPKFHLILNIGVRGQYGINIIDSRLFVSRIIGVIPNGTSINHVLVLRYFNGVINAKIKSVVAEYLIKKQISFLEISQYLSEISDAFKTVLDSEFERFGIEIINFYCEAITPKPSDYEKLKKKKEEISLKNLDVVKQPKTDIKCPFCNAIIPIGMNFCGKCGNSIISVKCSSCGFENDSGMNFCGKCGKKLQLN